MSLARKGYCAQCCGPLDLAWLLTESPCVMTTEVLDIRQLVQSPANVGKAIGNQNQLRPRPGQSSRKHSFGKRVRDVTVRGQSFIDNSLYLFILKRPVKQGNTQLPYAHLSNNKYSKQFNKSDCSGDWDSTLQNFSSTPTVLVLSVCVGVCVYVCENTNTCTFVRMYVV
jgi:hypothetical protein